MDENVSIPFSLYELNWLYNQFENAAKRSQSIIALGKEGPELKQAQLYGAVLLSLAGEIKTTYQSILVSYQDGLTRRRELTDVLERQDNAPEVKTAITEELEAIPELPAMADVELDRDTLKFVMQLADKHTSILKEIFHNPDMLPEETRGTMSPVAHHKRVHMELLMLDSLRNKLQTWL